MAFARTQAIALIGAAGHLIDVEADVSSGIPGTIMVGRPDVALNEARDRCRMAVRNSELTWPTSRRITISLSPADVPKKGSGFDLAIALAVLGASEQIPDSVLSGTVFLGELTLDGRLRAIDGVLPMVLAASARGADRVFLPEPHVEEAALVPGMEVIGVRSLAQAVAVLRGSEMPWAPLVPPVSDTNVLTWRGQERLDELDMGDVAGLADARYAAEVAAAGGHHLLLSGPKGAGKTTLAERIPGILPDLTVEESLELTAIHSLAGALAPGDGLITRPPFSAPHHDASRASLLGGGSGRVRPGEISRAHTGVLMLDEFPLFHNDVIQALRQPLESGEITIARGEETVRLPARAIVVLAANPCPCGNFHPSPSLDTCRCRQQAKHDYQLKLTGPVADRIDIVRHLSPVSHAAQADPFGRGDSTAIVRARVEAARQRQRVRYRGRSWRLNGHVPASALQGEWPLPQDAQRLIETALFSGQLTRRGAIRVHRLALTVADLAGDEALTHEHATTALALRSGQSLHVPHRECA